MKNIQSNTYFNFFDKKIVWEWNTMNAQMVKNKVKDLFEKTGVQVN